MSSSDAAIHDRILDMVAARGVDKTCCPSEIARALANDDGWRELMPRVRRIAVELARQERLCITQGGVRIEPQDAEHLAGPIRLGWPAPGQG